MLIAPWFLVMTMLVGGAAQSGIAASPPVLRSAFLAREVSFAPEGQGSSSSSGTHPHVLGFGGMLGAGPLGTGFGLRYWFVENVGLDMRFLLSRAELTIGTGGGASFEAAPSVIVMMTKPDPSRGVDIRPYIGGGANYTRAGTNAVITRSPVSGSGVQVFGGVEVTIREAGALAIGGEVLYNKRSQPLVTAGVRSGLTGLVAFLFYVK
jgi:hypothetical protein